MKTSEQSVAQLSLPLMSSAEDSPVRTSRPRAVELASLVLEAASGTSSLAALRNAVRGGSWSRTFAAELATGSTRSAETWDGLAMRAFRSRLQQAIAARPTSEHAFSSSLPTLTTNAGHRSSGGPSLETRVRLLPTLTASDYGSNHGGEAGRAGAKRLPLRRLLPTLTTQRATYATRRGEVYPTLHGTVDGPLNPTWLEWFMGFPEGWTASACSETASCPTARKSSVG